MQPCQQVLLVKLLGGDEGRTGTSCFSVAAAACLSAVGLLQAFLTPHSPGEAPGAKWVSSKWALPLRDHKLVPPALDGVASQQRLHPPGPFRHPPQLLWSTVLKRHLVSRLDPTRLTQVLLQLPNK